MWFRRKWLQFKKWISRKKKPTPKPYERNDDNNRPDRGENDFEIMHPDAVYLVDVPRLRGSYKFDPNHPDSICVGHVTAGWQNWSARSFFGYMSRQGYFTDYIDESGVIYQQGDGDETGPHVGKSKWVKANGRSMRNFNSKSRGVEMACGGKLKIWRNGKKKSWSKEEIPDGWVLKTSFGKLVKPENMRYVTTAMGYKHNGWFEILTKAQEEGYLKWCVGWMRLGVSPTRFIEHADASPDRRSDIGGCLSIPHDRFIKERVIPRFTNSEKELQTP